MVKQRIAIVGLGLIGGSLARRLVNAGCEVIAWNHNDRPYETAKADGIRCVSTLAALADTKPDVLVLCNPLKAMPQILGALKPLIDTDITTLTDVGSVKAMVREQVKAVGLEHCYVGAHPMAGNELSGWESSDPTLYDGALWAITVDENTEYQRFRAVATMIVDHCSNRLIVLDDASGTDFPHATRHFHSYDQRAGGQSQPEHRSRARRWFMAGHDSCCANRSKPYPCNGGRGRRQCRSVAA